MSGVILITIMDSGRELSNYFLIFWYRDRSFINNYGAQMKNVFYAFLMIFLGISISKAQVAYNGPASGSVASGVVKNTDNFTELMGEGSKHPRLFNHFGPKALENDKYAIDALAPEGSNLVYDTSLPSELVDTLILFKNFRGLGYSNSIPPDPYCAVGPNHVMQVVNSNFRIVDKNGTTLKSINADSWYNGVVSSPFCFDPKVLYDHFSSRWIMVWLHVNDAASQAYFMISVSDDDNPLGVWYNWAVTATTNGTTPSGSWGDYQGVGFDDKALYITSNQFSFAGSYVGAKIKIIPKSNLYQGSAGTVNWTDLWNISYPSASSASAFGIRPVRMRDASDEYYLVVHSPYTTGTSFGVYKLTNPLTTPSLTGAQVAVTTYTSPPNPQQLGGGSPLLEGGGANLRNEPVYQNGFLHLTHTVRSGTVSALRYLRIDPSSYSTIKDFAMTTGSHFHFYPALDVNGNGDIVFSYSRTSASEYAGAFYTVLLAGENVPLGSRLLKAGLGNYVVTFGGTRNRWGDYNGAWFDPSNDEDVWIYGEFVNSTNIWGTWMGGLKIPPRDPSAITWQSLITVASGANSQGVTFGFAPYGTDGLDTQLGEAALGSIPPAGTFDTRFILPGGSTGSLKDFRSDKEVIANWNLKFQPGSAGYPITFTWDSGALPDGLVMLKDASGSIVNVNMKTQNSYSLTNSSITSLNVIYKEQVDATVSVQNEWNIISAPVQTENMAVSAVFPTATSNAFSYNNGYTQAATLVSGKGYWLKFGSSQNILLTGAPVLNPVPVNSGWNIIGPFSTPVAVADITTDPSGIIQTAFFGFNGGYTTATTLEPGKGYWVRVNQAGTLNLSGAVKKDGNTSAITESLADMPGLFISDAAGHSSQLHFTAQTSLAYEMPPAPPAGIFDVRFASGLIAENIFSSSKQVSLNSAVYPLTLTSNDIALRIKDAAGAIYELKKNESLVIEKNSGNLEISAVTIPEAFNLSQNFPNPFNPSTVIKFTVAETNTAVLKIFNSLGEEVRTLFNAAAEPGKNYEVKFDASDLSSGIYFYVLRSGNMVQTKKMMLIK